MARVRVDAACNGTTPLDVFCSLVIFLPNEIFSRVLHVGSSTYSRAEGGNVADATPCIFGY